MKFNKSLLKVVLTLGMFGSIETNSGAIAVSAVHLFRGLSLLSNKLWSSSQRRPKTCVGNGVSLQQTFICVCIYFGFTHFINSS